MQEWRLIDTGAQNGALNMAIDEAILEVHAKGLTPPTLRFYRWETPTLSVGYAQPWDEDEVLRCQRLGVDLVRRPTGGRAVLHCEELTYSVVVSRNYGIQGSILETYRQLSSALACGLQTLGVGADLRPGEQKGGSRRACFAATTQADLGVGGGKLVGSAQLRRGNVLLQHGAIPLRPNAYEEPLLGATHAICLEQILGEVPAWSELVKVLCLGFERELGIRIVSGDLLACERELAGQLLPKYSLPRQAGVLKPQ